MPPLAARVRDLRRDDLESRTGWLISLHLLSGWMNCGGPHQQPARAEAERLLAGLLAERR